MNAMQLIAEGLDFPTSLALDGQGRIFVAESGLSFNGDSPGGRILQVQADGCKRCLCEGLRAPVNGLTFHEGALIVSEGGNPGRISRLSLRGERTTVLDGLPGLGNYHTNMAAVGPDGKLYFSQGALTNSGIVGLDAYELAWLGQLPHNHDIPGFDVVLTGFEAETPDPFNGSAGDTVKTGAFGPFGSPSQPGKRLSAQLPCTASVLRCNLDGSQLELVAWGLRNAYGLGFLPDGRLLATDQGADERGSRPIGNAPDLLYEVRQGCWYGWPDFIGGVPVTDRRFRPRNGAGASMLLANHEQLPQPQRPLLEFPVNAAAVKFDLVPAAALRWGGQLLVALFGDEKPLTAPAGPKAGRSLVRVDPTDWSLHALPKSHFERPIDVKFHPSGRFFHLLDFGKFEMTGKKCVAARHSSGRLWKVPLDWADSSFQEERA